MGESNAMSYIWDETADEVSAGDNRREIRPCKEYIDRTGYKHYIFSKIIFNNPRYIIPEDNFTLFYNFLKGGSREYPSDGAIPVDVVAKEAKIILDRIKQVSEDLTHKFYASARNVLKNGQCSLLRGTLRLYMSEYTTRDWRRKRSTDDIDFWVSDNILLEFVLKETGWFKNKQSMSWEKKIQWTDIWTGRNQYATLIASNDAVQLMDFGAGSHLEGSALKDIIKKKIVRGHDVDLSDIINVAIVNNIPYSTDIDSPWAALEEAANIRHKRVTSNLISLCRYSHGIADYLRRVAESIKLFKDLVLNPLHISNPEILKICEMSSHWLREPPSIPVDETRQQIFNNLLRQEDKKLHSSKTLKGFAYRVFDLLNSRFDGAKIVFEIYEEEFDKNI